MADAVTAYSTDEDLVPVYVANASALPDGLFALHAEAFAQIQRDLVAMDWTADELATLTDASIVELKPPSCHYVMYLIYRSQTHMSANSGLLDLAKFHLGEYQRALRAASIESTASAEDEPRSANGYVVLG